MSDKHLQKQLSPCRGRGSQRSIAERDSSATNKHTSHAVGQAGSGGVQGPHARRGQPTGLDPGSDDRAASSDACPGTHE
jgi:hypothetical protein